MILFYSHILTEKFRTKENQAVARQCLSLKHFGKFNVIYSKNIDLTQFESYLHVRKNINSEIQARRLF